MTFRRKTQRRCEECKRLEGDVDDAMKNISFVVGQRFPTVTEKLRKLNKCQNERNAAVQELNEHLKAHAAE